LTAFKTTTVCYAKIAVDAPIAKHFDYRIPVDFIGDTKPGTWVVVPWGKTRKLGIVFTIGDPPDLSEDRIKTIISLFKGAPRLPESWLALIRFASTYYHRGLGEVAINSIPKLLRNLGKVSDQEDIDPKQFQKWAKPSSLPEGGAFPNPPHSDGKPQLTADQTRALEQLPQSGVDRKFSCHVLFGVTGSGKTEVYLRWVEQLLQADPKAQVLLMVPEINLTPSLQKHIHQRFPTENLAVLHSGLSEGKRAQAWLAAIAGTARIIIGTRLAVLTPIPNLAAIVIDEEHDPSFKQHEAPHYSARDLGVVLANQRGIPIILASATPSLETWNAVRMGRYKQISLPERATGALPPVIHIVHLGAEKTLRAGLTEFAFQAIQSALEQKKQSLVFINRRGYAPVIHCAACSWMSKCDNCSAFQVLHRRPQKSQKVGSTSPYQLVCHHCASTKPTPKQCPACGNVDLAALGRGTQRLEENLNELFPQARIARLDRDAAQNKGAAEKILAAAHAGEIDILVGTQILAKGHDFQNLAEVIVVDSDSALFSADFRAPERLFATLMQVSGRAGRARDSKGRVTIQTRFEEHPLFEYLVRQDYVGFADSQLADRQAAALPPFTYQALMRLEAKTLDVAIAQLGDIRANGVNFMQTTPTQGVECIQLCDPVPMPIAKIAGRARAQLLIESTSRPALHRWLEVWLPQLKVLSLRWQIEIDPLEI
jgi:primosomal protein N' (replication factor Y) (superfamily II helicase)